MAWRCRVMKQMCCVGPEHGIALYMDLSLQIHFLEGKKQMGNCMGLFCCVCCTGTWQMIENLNREGFSMRSSCSSCGHGKEWASALTGAAKNDHSSKYGRWERLLFCATVLDTSEHLGFSRLMGVGNPCKTINPVAEFCWSSIYRYILVVSMTVTAPLALPRYTLKF